MPVTVTKPLGAIETGASGGDQTSVSAWEEEVVSEIMFLTTVGTDVSVATSRAAGGFSIGAGPMAGDVIVAGPSTSIGGLVGGVVSSTGSVGGVVGATGTPVSANPSAFTGSAARLGSGSEVIVLGLGMVALMAR